MSLIWSQRAHKTRDRDRPLIWDSTRKQTKRGGEFFPLVDVDIRPLYSALFFLFPPKSFNKVHSWLTPQYKLRRTFGGITRGGKLLPDNFANVGFKNKKKGTKKYEKLVQEKRNCLLGRRMANYANALHQILAPSQFLSSLHWQVPLHKTSFWVLI